MSDLVLTVQKFEYKLHEPFTKFPGEIVRIDGPSQSQFGNMQLTWVIVLDEDKGQGKGRDGRDRETLFWTPAEITLGPKGLNKLGRLIAELKGRAPQLDEPIALKEYIGQPVYVVFEHKTKEDGTKVERVFQVLRRE